MKKISLVYRQLLSQLRGEHFVPIGAQPDLSREIDFRLAEKTYLYEKGFFELIKTRWKVSDEQIIERGLVELPTFIENRLICRKLQKLFGTWVFALPIFKDDELRFDQRNFRRGFMRPILAKKEIIGFEIFRNIKDQNPIAVIGSEEARG
jgi:hypothetical protein